jgi:hypothetical protein
VAFRLLGWSFEGLRFLVREGPRPASPAFLVVAGPIGVHGGGVGGLLHLVVELHQVLDGRRRSRPVRQEPVVGIEPPRLVEAPTQSGEFDTEDVGQASPPFSSRFGSSSP